MSHYEKNILDEFENIYDKIKDSHTGRLLVSTNVCRKAAKMMGGDYDALSKIGKEVFRSTIQVRMLNQYQFDYFLNY